MFNQEVLSNQNAQRNRNEKIGPLLGKLAYAPGSLAEKVAVLEQILELDPQNRNIPAALGFYKAANEDWPGAMKNIRRFRAYNGRHTAVRMSLGLVEACILNYQGLPEKAQAHLEQYSRSINDAWYADICEFMLGKQTEASLKKKAAEKPENLLTAFAVLGFWAESSGDKDKAIKYYKLALESFLDTWLEFDFALERLKRLRQA
jgi:lipoprotein NlpI